MSSEQHLHDLPHLMTAIYDRIGITYSVTRCTDPVIARQLHAELRGANRILNIGAGTGSYEPDNIPLVALEPSSAMIAQRKPDAHPAKQASAEKLPFADNSFSHAMTVLSMHHWSNREQAFQEINRVTTDRFVAITWNPDAEPFWLTRDYFPEFHDTDIRIFPYMDEIRRYFDDVSVHPVLIPADCQDGFLAAFWKRPHAYLDSQVRASISSFSKISQVSRGSQKLENDLSSGHWQNHNQAILDAPALDAGYRLITARIRKPGTP